MADLNSAVWEGLRVADLTGVLANALLGGALARARGFDPVGFAVPAVVSGLGGGIIRDVLLQRGTPVALTDYTYVLTALAGAVVAFLLPVRGRVWDSAFPLVDAVALGCWAAAGAQKTLELGLGWLPAVLLGTITAVGGSVTRDVLLRQVPAIFGGNTLYATCALVASSVMVVFASLGHATAGLVVTTLVGATLTRLSQVRGWQLPDAYAWTPRIRSAGLPRPRWRPRRSGSDEQTPARRRRPRRSDLSRRSAAAARGRRPGRVAGRRRSPGAR
ncbi:conserved membrane hypothetical protein [Nostocoides japonicum T1-X7]|uniref:Glycine transporter domain-containing protein n=1 Tax=Nostocoides japonicum T1-X7 TaxID=1194083 RepID=A0A077LZK4_9MICO|nr:TRIC cation channel family protein [Tetrasphaera japonica]CCH79413.1 conserved membrane hypothetical protein [Tetrasphaera japonica T1-X7]